MSVSTLILHYVATLRLGATIQKAGKPAVYISTKFELWLGNASDSDMLLKPGEILGFGTGSYKEQVVGHLDVNIRMNSTTFKVF